MTEYEAIDNLKNLFSNYELALPNTDSLEILQFAIKALEEVREYRSLEEQGLLIRLPCKVGGSVYYVRKGRIIECVVSCVNIHRIINIIAKEKETGKEYGFVPNIIGKVIFLTREEAEAALERMW